MEKEQVTGKMDELKGKAKQSIGRATGDTDMQDEGVVDQLKGKVKGVVGDVKDAVKSADRAAGTDVKGE